jgi:transcription elongation factor GreA-like protein/transcription elongation GreA/GreB family factor
MSYLSDFREKIAANDYTGFLKLWEEYCYSDEPDGEELKQILLDTKKSDLGHPFGQHVNRAISLAKTVKDLPLQHEILKLIFDIQTLNSEDLAETAFLYLKEKYGTDPLFEKKIHLIGLRNKENFQGALSHYDLLSHIAKGKFVYHTAGWGTGEILDLSMIREELTLEFENVIGQKHLSFANAMRTLIPLSDDHFLARRFGDPDLLQKQAEKNPIEILHLLLRDLGPKNAGEIKEELCDLVIPSAEWTKWWQNAKTKLKKDTLIQSPKNLQDPFILLKKEVSHEESLVKALEEKPDLTKMIHLVYSHLRDFPETTKNKDLQASLQSKLTELLAAPSLPMAQKLQLYFLLDDLSLDTDCEKQIQEILQTTSDVIPLLQEVDVLSYKKRALTIIRKIRKDWQEIFFSLFFSMTQNFLRDYLLSELLTIEPKEILHKKLEEILRNPRSYPQVFIWYFQKILEPETKLPFSDPKGLSRFLEGFFILLDYLENKPEYREITKKMAQLLTANRYKVIRQIMQNASVAEVKEFILLSTKCRLLSTHDIKIIQSLAEVIFPSLAEKNAAAILPFEQEKLWALQESYDRMRKHLEHISTTEMILNAKEIEEARSHGDLRENAEYKAALEKRARIQGEMKTLSDALQKTCILTSNDVTTDTVCVGTVVVCKNSKGEPVTFTILGPWEATPEKNILSSQSKLAKRMIDKKTGDSFQFQDETFVIQEIKSFFNK